MPSSSAIPHSTMSALASSSSSSLSATSSPCAACKFLRRKCQPDCVFAPYFPPDNPQKFVHVHRVFGASNVTKILNELPTCQREDAVNSLAYEADMRLKDPVYGCVGVISILQHQLRQLQVDLSVAKAELLKYQSFHHPSPSSASMAATSAAAAGSNDGFGFLMGVGRDNGGGVAGHHYYQQHQHHHQHQQHHVMMRNYEAELTAATRMGINGGGYGGDGMMAAVNGGAAASMGILGGQFLKSNGNGGDERPATVGPS